MRDRLAYWLSYYLHYYVWPILSGINPNSAQGLKLRAEKLQEDEARRQLNDTETKP